MASLASISHCHEFLARVFSLNDRRRGITSMNRRVMIIRRSQFALSALQCYPEGRCCWALRGVEHPHLFLNYNIQQHLIASCGSREGMIKGVGKQSGKKINAYT